jgi:hypothetical protein
VAADGRGVAKTEKASWCDQVETREIEDLRKKAGKGRHIQNGEKIVQKDH